MRFSKELSRLRYIRRHGTKKEYQNAKESLGREIHKERLSESYLDDRALLDSIRKWKRIADLGIGEDAPCPLCERFQTFINHEPDSCGSCPVAGYTGGEFCGKTPYYEWRFKLWKNQDATLEAKAMLNILKEIKKIRKLWKKSLTTIK